MRHELPKGPLPEAAELAPLVRRSGIVDALRRFHAALADSEKLTAAGALRPTRARELIAALDLPDEGGWRSARDAGELNRLWEAATWAGLLEPHTTVARRRRFPDLDDDDTALRLGVGAFIGSFFSTLRYLTDGAGLTYALVRSYVLGCGLVTWEELAGFLDDWLLSARSRERGTSVAVTQVARTRADLRALADTGAVVVDDRGVRLTPLGDVGVTALLNHLENAER